MAFGLLKAQTPSPESILRSLSTQPIEPTTASLGRYGEYQMDYSNGLPEISIPLYEIKSGDLSVPIVLRYQGGGIKVQQEATWVGLGWDLFYGGQITRVVHGFPDEEEPAPSQRPTANQIRSYMTQHNSEINNSYLRNLAESKSPAYSFMPDEYYYTAGMESGKFIGEEEKLLIPHKPVTIKGGGTSWGITNSEGIIYSFKNNETTYTLSADHIMPSYTSAWNINRITSPMNRVISYEYQTDGYYVSSNSTSFEGYSYSYLDRDVPWYPSSNSNTLIPLKNSPVRMKVESKKPQYIYFDGGRVTFILSPRTDIQNNESLVPIQKLGLIYIERLQSNGSYEAVKYYRFNYFYRDNRLFLSSVDEFTFSSSENRRIAQFEYDSTPLPTKDSYSYDYCGYYNGSRNTTPIPRYNFATSGGMVSFGGANKNVVESFTKAGILISVKYPTNGKTLFTWENHHYGAEQPIYDRQYITDKSVGVSGRSDIKCSDKWPPIEYDDDGTNFTFTNYVDQHIQISGVLKLVNTTDFQHQKYDKGTIIFRDLTTGNVLLDKSLSKYITISINEVIHLLPNHTYSVTASTNCSNVTAYLGFTYNEYDPSRDKYNYPYGGLRIKEIANFDVDGRQLNKKVFTYKNPNNMDRSSGYITSVVDVLLSKHSKTLECISCGPYVDHSCMEDLYKYTVTNLYYDNPMTGIYSNNLSYQYVQVQNQDMNSNNNGITRYEFKTHLDQQLNTDLPAISNSSLRGQLLKESIYNSEDKLLNEIVNYYSNHQDIKGLSKGLKVVQGVNLLTLPCSYSFTQTLDLEHLYIPYDYTYYSNWCKMDSTIKYNYYGANKIIEKSEYVYGDLASCRPTRITSILNNEKKRITDITYPPYVTQELPFATKEEKINNTFIYKQTNKYSTLLDSIRIKYGTMLEETEIKVKRDGKNNIKEFIPRLETPTVYLWAYNGLYLIAEIKNASYSQVTGYINETTLNSIFSKVEPSTSDIALINGLRTQLPNALITTYTYKHLVGILSATNPSGITTYYDYDSFGRLKETYIYKDNIVSTANKQTIQKYDYHYQNQ